MDCPSCTAPTSVIEKRAGDRRRRECSACLFRFTTYEITAGDLHSLQADRHRLEQLGEILRAPASSDETETRPIPLDILLPS